MARIHITDEERARLDEAATLLVQELLDLVDGRPLLAAYAACEGVLHQLGEQIASHQRRGDRDAIVGPIVSVR